jgi:hypothetical protein
MENGVRLFKATLAVLYNARATGERLILVRAMITRVADYICGRARSHRSETLFRAIELPKRIHVGTACGREAHFEQTCESNSLSSEAAKRRHVDGIQPGDCILHLCTRCAIDN